MPEYERFGEYQSSQRRGGSAGLAITFLLIGMGAGALIALMVAPQEGKKTRKILRRKYEDAVDAFSEWKETAEDMIEKGGDWASSAKETAKEKVAPFRKAMKR
ncbi:MAG TPA: YtxH domain-containing protein [Terriglobales bacterium]|nr:YtxH domain-containing protein [Terriglobales bacterium]